MPLPPPPSFPFPFARCRSKARKEKIASWIASRCCSPFSVRSTATCCFLVWVGGVGWAVPPTFHTIIMTKSSRAHAHAHTHRYSLLSFFFLSFSENFYHHQIKVSTDIRTSYSAKSPISAVKPAASALASPCRFRYERREPGCFMVLCYVFLGGLIIGWAVARSLDTAD